MPQLSNFLGNDGSRQFLSLDESRSWNDVRDYVSLLLGAVVTGFITDDVTEAWIDFTWSGHEFTINNQFGEYWFNVNDPGCPEPLLVSVALHFEKLLQPSAH